MSSCTWLVGGPSAVSDIRKMQYQSTDWCNVVKPRVQWHTHASGKARTLGAQQTLHPCLIARPCTGKQAQPERLEPNLLTFPVCALGDAILLLRGARHGVSPFLASCTPGVKIAFMMTSAASSACYGGTQRRYAIPQVIGNWRKLPVREVIKICPLGPEPLVISIVAKWGSP